MKLLLIPILLVVLVACQARNRAPEYELETPATPDHLYDIEAKRYELTKLLEADLAALEEATKADS